ncbi:hypothetical protein MAR_035829 [Mya arenaria]|uniref:Uncharacterized protein n=1 Tax=Mya arenaria TaxID=6604 RepID=A0ABY7EL94_MYAAR|nr:hypothetical protein MAR_035829 [Mya arenaria]
MRQDARDTTLECYYLRCTDGNDQKYKCPKMFFQVTETEWYAEKSISECHKPGICFGQMAVVSLGLLQIQIDVPRRDQLFLTGCVPQLSGIDKNKRHLLVKSPDISHTCGF